LANFINKHGRFVAAPRPAPQAPKASRSSLP